MNLSANTRDKRTHGVASNFAQIFNRRTKDGSSWF